MKKILIISLAVVLLVIGYSYDQFGWCKKLLSGGPTTHVIQKGEYLSEIAKKYYSRADYWRELALINRSPDCDLVFPGEEIIIPSLEVIKEIRRTRWLSKVNAYVRNEQDIMAQLNKEHERILAENAIKATPGNRLETEPGATTSEPGLVDTLAQTASAPIENKAQSASTLGLVLGIIALIFVASLIAFIVIRQRKRSQQIAIFDDDDLSLLDKDEESEPDYQEYLRKKSRGRQRVLVS